MKPLKTLSLLFAATSLLASCSNDFDLGGIFSEAVSEVNVSIADADYTETIDTRSSHSVDPSRGFVTTWTEGDTIGIYPIGADQVAFPISGGEGSSTAKFDGGAWSLRASRQYGAYYPFSKKNYYIDETRIPISYLGQKQTGNNNLGNLSYYDFMAAAAVSPDANGAVNMTMQHLGAFLRLTITAPEAKTYTKVRLSSDAAIFTTDATINLQDGSLTPTKKAEVLTLLLDNVTTTEPNQTITAYMMLAPISASDISAHPISVTLFDDNGVSYVADLSFTSVVAGKSYAKSASVKRNSLSDTQLTIAANVPDYMHITINGKINDLSLIDSSSKLYLSVGLTEEVPYDERLGKNYTTNVYTSLITLDGNNSFTEVLANGGIHGKSNGLGDFYDRYCAEIPQGQTYYYQLTIVTGDKQYYSPINSFYTPVYQPVPITWSHSVDLGLSVKWCMSNLGATGYEENTFGDPGYTFRWAETEPYESLPEGTPYKWGDISSHQVLGELAQTEHNNNRDYDIKGMPEYDPANTMHGGGICRMSTIDEWFELENECTWYYTTINGYTGYQVVGKNGNNIWIPYSTEKGNHAVSSERTEGDNVYWSSCMWNAWGNVLAYCITICDHNCYHTCHTAYYWVRRENPGFIRSVSDY